MQFDGILAFQKPTIRHSDYEKQKSSERSRHRSSSYHSLFSYGPDEYNQYKVIALFTNEEDENQQLLIMIDRKQEQRELRFRKNLQQELSKLESIVESYQSRYESYLEQANTSNVTLPSCDLTCSARCFSELKYRSVKKIYQQCLKPLCQCHLVPLPDDVNNFYATTNLNELQEDQADMKDTIYQEQERDSNYFIDSNNTENTTNQTGYEINYEEVTYVKWRLVPTYGESLNLTLAPEDSVLLKNYTTQTIVLYVQPRFIQLVEQENDEAIYQVADEGPVRKIVLRPIVNSTNNNSYEIDNGLENPTTSVQLQPQDDGAEPVALIALYQEKYHESVYEEVQYKNSTDGDNEITQVTYVKHSNKNRIDNGIQCSVKCAKKCLKLINHVPYEVLGQCVQIKCDCYFNETVEQKEIITEDTTIVQEQQNQSVTLNNEPEPLILVALQPDNSSVIDIEEAPYLPQTANYTKTINDTQNLRTAKTDESEKSKLFSKRDVSDYEEGDSSLLDSYLKVIRQQQEQERQKVKQKAAAFKIEKQDNIIISKRTIIKVEGIEGEQEQVYEDQYFNETELGAIRLVASNLGFKERISMFTNDSEALNNISVIKKSVQDHKTIGYKDAECYFTCAKQCFGRYPDLSPNEVYKQCLGPQCFCGKFDHYPDDNDLQNQNPRHVYDFGVKAKYNETAYAVPEGYSITRDCNQECANDCLQLRSIVSWEVLDICIKQKCLCLTQLTDHYSNAFVQVQPISLAQVATYPAVNCDRACAYANCLKKDMRGERTRQCLYDCGCTKPIAQQVKEAKEFEEAQAAAAANNQSQSPFLSLFETQEQQEEDCKPAYCNYFRGFKNEESVFTGKVQGMIKTRAILAARQIQWDSNSYQFSCDTECIDKCFQDTQTDVISTINDCAINQCGCQIKWLNNNLESNFLQQQIEGLNNQQNSSESKNNQATDSNDTYRGRAIFNVKFTIKPNTCCLAFMWQYETNFNIMTPSAQQPNIYNQCDLNCQSECLFLPSEVPFPVVKSCVTHKCGCDYNSNSSLPNVMCDKDCKYKCLSSVGQNNQADQQHCLANCGCLAQADSNMQLYVINSYDTYPIGENSLIMKFSYIVFVLLFFILVGSVSYIVFNKQIKKNKQQKRLSVYKSKEFEEDSQDYYQKLH